jgi:hypothetical protein
MAPPPKRKKADLALLMEAEPEETDPLEDEGFEEEDDLLGEELPLDDEEEADPLDPLADPLAAESSIDPEQADLCVTLGFTDPEQQQALIDLIGLVNAPKTDMGMESELPPLPESTY